MDRHLDLMLLRRHVRPKLAGNELAADDGDRQLTPFPRRPQGLHIPRTRRRGRTLLRPDVSCDFISLAIFTTNAHSGFRETGGRSWAVSPFLKFHLTSECLALLSRLRNSFYLVGIQAVPISTFLDHSLSACFILLPAISAALTVHLRHVRVFRNCIYHADTVSNAFAQ